MSKLSIGVLQLQLIVLILLALNILYVFIPYFLLVALQVLLSIAYLYILFRKVGKERVELCVYVIFFLGLLAIVLLASVVPWIAIDVSLKVYYLIGLLIAAVVFFFAFKLFYGRNYFCAVVVSSSNEITVVEKDFDLRSFTNAAEIVIKQQKSYAIGKEIKVSVKRGFFGRKSYKIVE